MKTNLGSHMILWLLISPAISTAQPRALIEPLAQASVASATEITCQYEASETEMASVFQTATQRLKDINGWGRRILPPGQKFQLVSPSGRAVRTAEIGNFVRIYPAFLLTGFREFASELKAKDDVNPTTLLRASKQISKSYFWVQIEEIQESTALAEQHFQLKVRPSINPVSPDRSPLIRHMFTAAATNTFLIQRRGRNISVSVVGQNERINLSEGFTPEEKMIHFAAATSSWGKLETSGQGQVAGAGLQKVIWTSLLWSLLPKSAHCAIDGKSISTP